MIRRTILGAATCLFLTTCGVKPYNQTQYAECFQAYSEAYGNCNDDTCKTAALETYRNCAGDAIKIPLHFVVLTSKLADNINTNPHNFVVTQVGAPSGTKIGGVKKFMGKSEIIDFLKTRIDTLNRYYTVEDASLPPDNRRKIVTFEFKSATLYNTASKITDSMITVALDELDFDRRHDVFKPTMNENTHPKLFDPNAVNVYIADCVDAAGDDVGSSHGNNNGNKPYVVLDYARITGVRKRQAVEEHELGHAFGLEHVCDPNAITSTSTNIMASGKNCLDANGDESSGGLRDIGFTPEQCRTILEKVDAFLATID